ncbi:hypothetical protein DM813_24205 [Pseudomonas alkylphenolica]|uniref:DUF7024 domain-containing protein n=1 Tax=Pseudomonas alkylphenolica TaxID=237609 RepID=A0A443ZGB7_9PSED|nr:hypothetical protein [Pseudomonas alkylphenolica]RWU17793.1 hypothetical protein DM813_24205 [Pseudomonas alkylphenolica]
MKNPIRLKASYFLLGACILSFLIFRFSRFIQTTSFDLVQHLLLVDELTRNAGVQANAFDRIGPMALYPPASHWMATIIGWVGGSGLVGITIVTIASVYLCYVLIINLVDASSPKRVLLFSLAFLVLTLTSSQIGWEVAENFFYPQIVADVMYFGILLWVSRDARTWKQTILFLLAGLVTMWIQPLVAIHVLAAGCALMAFQVWKFWSEQPSQRISNAACLAALIVGSVLIIFTNPAFKVMRMISANDGGLYLGYDSFMLVAFLCAAIGVWNLRQYWRGRAEYTDAVLGSAVVGAVGLVVIQFAMLKLFGDGSNYAIKKHMFIVFTLGIVNAVRVAAAYFPFGEKGLNPGWVAPVLAGVASMFVFDGYNKPVAPILNAMTYAANTADYQMPGFIPGNTVFLDSGLPLMGNLMVTLTALQHPFNPRAISWQRGASMTEGVKYAIVRRTPHINTVCDSRFIETANFVVIDPACMGKYAAGEKLNFASGGNGWSYASGGWSVAEAWGAWAFGNAEASVVLRVPSSSYQLQINGRAYVTQQHPKQIVVAEVNGTEVATWSFDLNESSGTRTAEIPKDLIKDGSLRIVLKAPGSVSPAQIGQSADTRVLGIGLHTLTLVAVP